MRKVIIIGTSELSVCFYKSLIYEIEYEVVAFTVNREFIKDKVVEGLPVIPFEDLSEIFNMSEYEIALTIGYKKMNDIREYFYNECKRLGYKIMTYISPKAIVYSDKIGEGTLIYPGAYVGPYCEIGVANIIHMQVCVSHHIKTGNFNFLAGGTMIGGNVVIGSNCFIGMSNTIRNGIKIGDRVLIGAKNYVPKDLRSKYAFIGKDSCKPIYSDFLIKFI